MFAQRHFSGRAAVPLLAVGGLALAGVCVGFDASGAGGADGRQPASVLALQHLQRDFHGANTLGDYELMHSLWAEDAVVMAAGQVFVGPDDIADFFASGPYWGRAANLSPTYKNLYDIQGDTAAFRFECVLVDVSGMDPLTTPFSTIPFGGQNPDVEIVQHSTAEGTMVKERGRWVIKTFNGSAGPP